MSLYIYIYIYRLSGSQAVWLCKHLVGHRYQLLVKGWSFPCDTLQTSDGRTRIDCADSRRRKTALFLNCCSFTPRPSLPPLTPTWRLKTPGRFHPQRSVSAAYCFSSPSSSASPGLLCSVQQNGSGNSSSVTLQNLHLPPPPPPPPPFAPRLRTE